MSITSDGMLYFGIPAGGSEDVPEWLKPLLDEDDDLTSVLLDDAGVAYSAPFPQRLAVLRLAPVELRLYCSYDYPMYVLAVRGLEHRVYRGDSKVINAEALDVPPEKIAAFKAWCEDHGVPCKEPCWLLCSMYG